MNLKEKAKEFYPEAVLTKHGKTVTEFFTVDLKGKTKEHDNRFNAKKVTKYDWEGKIKGIPEITFEIDNVLMKMRVFEEINSSMFNNKNG